jgi:hypothetical protein
MKHVPFVAASIVALLALTISCGTSSATGSAGTKLTLVKPANQWMAQGATNRVAIAIARKRFDDSVQVSFSNLPAGVRVDGDTIAAGDSFQNFVLVADATAAVVDKQVVTVTASSAGISVSETFELTVKAKA